MANDASKTPLYLKQEIYRRSAIGKVPEELLVEFFRHTLVLDAGPILKNTPPLSTLLARSEELITTPAVVREIRDPDARARVETLYLPFLKQRSPTPKSVAVLSEFARKTGDRTVLSKTDIEVLALAYEIECERNGGDWRLE